MKRKCLFTILLICLFFASPASFTPLKTVNASDTTFSIRSIAETPISVKAKRIRFFQKIALRIAIRKWNKQHKIYDATKADKMASASLWLGIAAIVFAIIPWYTILVAIPLGILAMIFGNKAKNAGTTKTSSASIGKSFGLAALIVVGVWIIVGAIISIAWINAWGSLFE